MDRLEITVAARGSALSRAQVEEVESELRKKHSELIFKPSFVSTYGDQNKQISLRTLGKTDFFTREVDELLLTKQCRIAIHSAKDLPEPLPQGLMMIALTRELDSSDSLVLREGESFEALPTGSIIATSSERREEAIKKLRSDLTFIDLRGTIDERLRKLYEGVADGVVVAEAALIRLKLTHVNRMKLEGPTVPFQGQLAILARDDDHEMATFFALLDVR